MHPIALHLWFKVTYMPGTSCVKAIYSYLHDLDTILQELCSYLLQAQDCMMSYANHHLQELAFEVGVFICLKLQPYRQTSVALRLYEPFKILEMIGPVAY